MGVLHVDAQARGSFACDLMEAARPQVDAYLLDWITRQPLKREYFLEERNGNCRLMGPFTMRLSETAATWGRAVAPVVEWVAQALWRSKKPAHKNESIPTRLTQRRRSEGRGNTFTMKADPVPRRERICEVCGAEGVQKRYCRSCAVEVSRVNMAQTALIGDGKPKSIRLKARISRVLSDHAVANTWWSPSSLPSWLNEDCYLQNIQPRLKTLKVREISAAMKVSKPYAAHVRAGRRRPHPRHWEKLASLAGAMPGGSNHSIVS
jgi:hypothetical protein